MVRTSPSTAFLACLFLAAAGCGGSMRGNESSLPAADSSSEVPMTDSANDDIRVSRPRPGEIVRSPLVVTGEARGTWFFEASFPVKLLDARGNVIGTALAEAKGAWMTPHFVPFEARLTFTTRSQ